MGCFRVGREYPCALRPYHAGGVDIINFAEIAYHQCKALYIIKPQGDVRWRVMIYKGGVPPLMIYTLSRDDMPSLRLG